MRNGRLNGQEVDVCELMAPDPEKWWYPREMARASEKKLGQTSIYVVLTRMAAFGLLETQEGKQRHYRLSEYGRKVYEVHIVADRAAARLRKEAMRLKPKGAMG
jgi:DNA-binding PadR family transcriptional regulator